ncbi:MAG TPA: hypothetical protein VH325_02340 [Bryobacteraceae bacterium]|jgi:hypothetical protein|nr:hypothetical protein [Bryobacteraceae bacterium]
MTTSNQFAYVVNVLACLALLIRLSTLRLRLIYRVFSAYLVFTLVSWGVFYAGGFHLISPVKSNYVFVWFGVQLPLWIVYVWMAYDLLDAVLSKLPGILSFSRKLMLAMFGLATMVSFLSAQNEYAAGGLRGLEGVGLVLDRAISSTVLIVLLAVLGFLFRFPVDVPRNLAAFSLSFVAFFGFNVVVDLVRAYFTHEPGAGLNVARFQLLSLMGVWLQSGCLLFLTFYLSRAGENVPVRLGRQSELKDRDRLLGQLDAVNAALLRAARR